MSLPLPAVEEQTSEHLEEIYRGHYDLLSYLARQKFRIPPCDADSLIHEVFLSFLSSAEPIRNVRSWLVGAVCNASRYYWRVHDRTESLPEGFEDNGKPGADVVETMTTRLMVNQMLGHLHQKCRETLRLRYFEGCSAAEVARELDTTNRYAEKLIHNCLKRAHEIYRKLSVVMR